MHGGIRFIEHDIYRVNSTRTHKKAKENLSGRKKVEGKHDRGRGTTS